MRRIRFTISYDGTGFCGWQAQPGRPTIQGSLEGVLAGIEGAPVKLIASGRTDAGVHALAQVAACTLANPIPVENLRRAMNRLLPHSIRIIDAAETAAGFHPRYDAISKTYEYRIWRQEVCPPFIRRYVHHHPYPLDVERMCALAPALEGEHDFTAFAAADDSDSLGRSKVRKIFKSELIEQPGQLIYCVRGSGFLKHMVRNIVGTLIEGGKRNLQLEQLEKMLEPGYPVKAGPAAPACGLFLIGVEYAE